VLIVDEAQSVPLDLLEEVRLLANLETGEGKLLCVIVAGQLELATRLNEQALRQLKQRIALRSQLRALTLQETAAYVAGRIRTAGGVGAQVFTREAVGVIHERAKGLPRTISVIADNALVSGFALGQRPVGSQLVREVCRDFDIDSSAGDASEQSPRGGAHPGVERATSLAGALLAVDTPAVDEPVSHVSTLSVERPIFTGWSGKRRRFSFWRNWKAV
jgi:predicted nucleic acid-binding protein